MLNISDETKEEFLKDSSPKQICIEIEKDNTTNVGGVNWYLGDATRVEEQSFASDKSFVLITSFPSNTSQVYSDYFDYAPYLYISIDVRLMNASSATTPSEIYLKIVGLTQTYYKIDTTGDYGSALRGDGLRIYVRCNNPDELKELRYASINFTKSTNFAGKFQITNFQIESSNIEYSLEELMAGALPFLGESVIRQGKRVTDYIHIGKPDIETLTNKDFDMEKFSITESLCSGDELKFGACEAAHCEFSIIGRYDDFTNRIIYPYYIVNDEKIPLGRFKVTDIKKSYVYNTCQLDITAYDDLVNLDTNAANWYTLYMYNPPITSDIRWGVPYARQVYSSYWNIINYLGIDNRSNHTEVLLGGNIGYLTGGNNNIYTDWTHSDGDFINRLEYGSTYISLLEIQENELTKHPLVVDVDYLYGIDGLFPANMSYYPVYSDYKKHIDEYARGAYKIANILVEEELSDGSFNRFCVNDSDYFMLSPNCEGVTIYVAYRFWQHNWKTSQYASKCPIINRQTRIYYAEDLTPNLANASTRLMYYNYGTKELFDCDSGITARDVVRSLLEVTGCFFNLDRYGVPEFRYCIKAGLYPNDKLYPSDSLYPRGVSTIIPMSKYISAICQDYEVKDYGRIQIVKRQNSNESKNVCEWEYIGNSNYPNAYIINDNIFYCSENMEYDYENMPEVALMLENLYEKISNMGYTPNTTNMVAMPWMEVGDRAVILTRNGGFESFVFRRTIKGIQATRDTIESVGPEYSDIVYDYGYKNYKGD